MITVYLHEKEKWSGEEGHGVHIFWLTADEEGKKPVTRFSHTGQRDLHRGAHERQLRFIDNWAKQARVRIGNREQWSLGQSGSPQSDSQETT